MKILYHHRTLGDGAEGIHVESMINAFRKLGHDVRVAAMIGEHTNVCTARTRALERVARWTPRPLYEALEMSYSVAGYRRLTAEIRRWRPDVIYERYVLFNVGGVAAARRFAVPLILEVNAPIAWERGRYERLSLGAAARRCERWVCRHADHVVAVSTPLKAHLMAEGVPDERIRVVPNGADAARFRPMAQTRERVRRELGLAPGDVVVGFSGILRSWHGIELLVDAVAEADRQVTGRLRLLVVGDGPSRADLEQLISARQLGRLAIITGRVSHARVPGYLAAFDIGVSPRATFYASPMKVLEYMAMGMAVAAPRMPNLADLIDDGRTGVLFTPDDPTSLAASLVHLATAPERRFQLATAARQEIVERRTWTHVAEDVLGFVRLSRSCA